MDEIINENTTSYDSVADKTLVSPSRSNEGAAQQSTTENAEPGRLRALNIVHQQYQTPEKSLEQQAAKGPSPKNSRSNKKPMANEQSWNHSPGAQKSGFSEVKCRFD